jgi:hypothetical protein
VANCHPKNFQCCTAIPAEQQVRFHHSESCGLILIKKLNHRSFFRETFLHWNDDEFRRNMRMNRQTFLFVCRRLYKFLVRIESSALSVRHQCAIAIYRLANGGQVRRTAQLFGVSDSSVVRCTQRFVVSL